MFHCDSAIFVDRCTMLENVSDVVFQIRCESVHGVERKSRLLDSVERFAWMAFDREKRFERPPLHLFASCDRLLSSATLPVLFSDHDLFHRDPESTFA